MNAIELQQLKDEITEKMIEGLQNQNFDKILEKYDVLGKAKLKFLYTIDLDTVESTDVKDIPGQEVLPQTCGWCMPCPSNPNLKMCRCC
ncbi:MAG: hypothetical protein KME29_40105 [Calothrix sp. FI2-JRJ7]|jgi:hypothetical protein|nr:hypothetical protein [Calothrix sp. FI2-JRJ7]